MLVDEKDFIQKEAPYANGYSYSDKPEKDNMKENKSIVSPFQWKILLAFSMIIIFTFGIEFMGNALEAWPRLGPGSNENPYNPTEYTFSLILAFPLGVLAILSTCLNIFKSC